MDLFNIKAFSIDLSNIKSHKARRYEIKSRLCFDFSCENNPDFIVVESVRLFHHNFINLDAIKRLGGIIYLIVDFYNCPVYQIDTRSWKKIILGSSKVEKDYSTIYIKGKYDIIGNNDLADSVCLAECGMIINHYREKFKRIE